MILNQMLVGSQWRGVALEFLVVLPQKEYHILTLHFHLCIFLK